MFQTATLDVNVPPDIGLRNMVLAKESPVLPSKSANVNIFYELFPTQTQSYLNQKNHENPTTKNGHT
jgi:hypothetical protein